MEELDQQTPPVSTKSEMGIFQFQGLFEHRGQARISERELGKVVMSIRPPGKENWVPVNLTDFTSISFGVHIVQAAAFISWTPEPEAPTQPEGPARQIQAGDELELRVQINHFQEFQIWCEVKNTIPWKNGLKAGLRRLDLGFPCSVEVDRRVAFRLPLAPALSLKARIKHPFIYGYWCPLQISDINRDMGLSFVSTDPSILLFEGMELQVHFELSSYQESPMTVRVVWVHATNSSQLKFGALCMGMDWKLHNGIRDFLLFSRHWTPARLSEAGFHSQQVKSSLRFRTVKNMQDYAEVLYLRRDAQVGIDKNLSGVTPESMASRLDGSSRILMAHHHDKLVGSMIFTYPTSQDTVLESQAGFPGQKFPVDMPPNANLIEVSRLCIHEEYRGTDLIQGLFEHGIKHFLTSDRHWLLTSASADMLPNYQQIGFVKLGAKYKQPTLNNQEHHLIMAHRNAFLWGKGMNLLVWSTLFGDVIQYLVDRDMVTLSKLDRLFIRAKLLLLPLSRRFLENRAGQAFRRHLETLRRASIRQRRPETVKLPPEFLP